ncbi:hypothetical protein HUE87_03730 [Candidatus Sulfurimonas marisnigri]|uniref:Uncharacterized protein n=1 Tax=Candidatus Sulfurimonas marisnigri TaxID=2740405 RepID=A0A7S7M1I9_9BACT|nr:hypothetical protein [Candidatus Sulfurimonas marisnigri]QOY55359.1 hypothetical protein HUE87_03730 [Candidatus Sulfurimonas marisnigri]
MLVEQKEKLQTLIGLIDNIAVNPDVTIQYCIPGVLMTADGSGNGDPYIQFTYAVNGLDPHIQHMPLTRSYLEKTPQDLANLFTFSLERFMEEIDSRQYGAQ